MEFSIIYTTYRPGGFDILADSLRNQTMKNYELIIVDDYPIDRRELIKSYLEGQGIPVAYIGPCKPKCFPELAYNIGNAVNTGILLSTKEIVILLQDYQWLPPDWLEKFAKCHALFKDNYCIVLPGRMWDDFRPKNNEGLISLWSQPWKGRPEENGCQEAMVSVYSGKPSSLWIPEAWEYSCIALPWNVICKANGWPECLDSKPGAHSQKDRVFEAAGGKPYVDKDNFMEMLNHRVWLPHELWWAPHIAPAGSTEYIERENCFDLKSRVRGKAYWLENTEAIFQNPEYWCGQLGYRPPDGYKDFRIHQVKVDYIMSKEPKGKVLDIGCAFGYIVKRLRDKEVDAFGIDISHYALSQAPNEVKPYLQLASADNLPFKDKEFDIVFSASTFEHLPPGIVPKAISEAVRVAKRGIIAVTPGDDPLFDEDITHQTKRPLTWWRAQFSPQFEVRNDASKEWRMVKINLGSFVDTIGYGWENWDILSIRQHITKGHKFKQWDVRRGLSLANGSVDLFRVSHLIEHLTLEESHNLCRELYRVLKVGGVARISTPDARIILKHYQNRDMSFFNRIQPPEYIQAPTEGEKLSRLLFSDPAEHKAIYNFEMIKDFLEQAGFEPGKIYNVSPGFSHSEVMKNETEDQHVDVSLYCEAIK